MAWFRCGVVPGQGGSGADLIVTCSQNFAGKTITCTNGVDTFTQQCPSSSPYEVTFESIPTGSWTISGVISGQTFSTTKTITDFTATLADIPDGATVTPTDVIQTWLHCANIWDKNYTTINQVLSDTTTLLALISSTNAVDYMVRSTTWASSVCANSTAMTYIGSNNYCANKLLANSTWCNAICNSTYFENVLTTKVPTMTSYNTPSGNVIYSSNQSNGLAWYAFNGNNTNSWFPDPDGSINQYVGYDFGSAVLIKKAGLVPSRGIAYGLMKMQYRIEASNDASFSTKVTLVDQSAAIGQDSMVYYDFPNNNTKYRYYRIYVYGAVATGSRNWYSVDSANFWGRA